MENDFCEFKGWTRKNVDIAKLVRQNKIITKKENELMKIADVIKSLKAPLYQQLEKAALQKEIQISINTFPSFTSNLRQAAEFVSEFICDSDDDLQCQQMPDSNSDVKSKDNTMKEFAIKRRISSNNSYKLVYNAVKKKCIPLTEKQTNLLAQLGQPVVLLHPLSIPDFNKNTSLKLRNSPDIFSRFENQLPEKKRKSSVTSNADRSLHTAAGRYLQHSNTHKVSNKKVKSKSKSVGKLILKARKNLKFDLLELVQDQFSLMPEYEESENNSDREWKKVDDSEMIQSLSIDYNLEEGVRKHVLNIHGQNCLEHENKAKENVEESDSVHRDPSLQTEVALCKLSNIIQFTKKEILSPRKKSSADFEENKQEVIIDKFLSAIRKTADDSQIVSALDRNFICNYCNGAFLEKSTLRKHILICSMRDDGFHLIKTPKKKVFRKSYECKLCQTTYISKTTFIKHNENKHHLTRPYKCLVCRWGFYSEKGLQHHCRTRHGISEFEPFKCPFCGVAFSRRSDINYHCRKYHSNMKWYACTVCFDSFKSESALHRHEHKNHGYTCDVCSFTTKTESEIEAHRLTHLQIVTYKCEICSRIFDKKGYFTKHIHMHQREKHN